MKCFILCVLVLFTSQTIHAGETIILESKAQQNTLLELYTSEGCSSCPSANRWLSTLKKDKRLWNTIIPLAFHVDYWDYLGWKDKFSSPVYSQRQRNYKRNGNLNSVYTPGFVKNGKEWRGWFGIRKLSIDRNNTVGVLAVVVNDNKLSIKFAPQGQISSAIYANIALLGFGLKHQIEAGENEGQTLYHDFVVLDYQIKQGIQFKSKLIWEMPWEHKMNANEKSFAIAVWLNETHDPTPIQAVGGWL